MSQTEGHSQSRAQGTRLWPKLLLLVGSIIATFATFEVVAQVLGWGGVVEFVPNDDWGFLMRPSQVVSIYGHPVAINALGFRGPELRDPKPSDMKRVVFIGDSVTYGGGRIQEQQLFCRIVESRARAEGLTVEAVNLSAPGWSPQNWWGYIDKRGLHEADVVVLILPECDLVRVFADMDKAHHQKRAPLLRLQSLVRKVQAQFDGDRLSATEHRDKVIAANLDAVIRLKKRCSSIHFLAVLVPSTVPKPPDETLWSIFTPHLPDPVDLRQELLDPTFFLDGTHLSVQGHAHVGEKLFPVVRQMLQGDRHQ